MVRFSRPIYEEVNRYWYLHLFEGDKDIAEIVWEPNGTTRWRIANLQVGRQYQDKGYGRMIVNHLEGLARKKGIKTIDLHALWDAYPFWFKMGYRRTYNDDEGGSYGMDKIIA